MADESPGESGGGTSSRAPEPFQEDCLIPFCRSPQRFLVDRARTHGPVALYRLNEERFASLSDAGLIHSVLHGSMDDFEKGPLLDVVRYIFGHGPFSADREDWSLQQKAIAPRFAAPRIHRLHDTIADFSEHLVSRWRQGGEHDNVDVLASLKRLAFDVVAVGLLSLNDERRRAGLFDGLYQLDRQPWVTGYYLGRRLPLERLAGVLFTGEGSPAGWMKESDEQLYAIVDERLAAADQPDDAIRALLASPAVGAMPSQRRRLLFRDLISSLLTAGFVSTGETMFWTLFHLARHPEVQERARQEVLAGPQPSGEAGPYLAAVIHETLRLYPPAWYIGRTTRRSLPLGGVDLPAGTQVVCSPYVLHRMPELWPDPERFSPDRFLPGVAQVPHSFIPFGSGLRACLGRALAWMEVTALVTATLRAFTLEPGFGPEVPALLGAYSLQPREPIGLRLRPRR